MNTKAGYPNLQEKTLFWEADFMLYPFHEKDICVYFTQKNILGFGEISYRQKTNISAILRPRNKAILLGGDTCNNFK